MRQIKFRLIKDGKVVGYEEHREGCIFRAEFSRAKKKLLKYFNIMTNISRPVIYDSKDQFTGLLDKNGVEIYEEDIVFNHMLHPNGSMKKYIKRIATIKWDIENASHLEVIGNIHTNPELLEEATNANN